MDGKQSRASRVSPPLSEGFPELNNTTLRLPLTLRQDHKVVREWSEEHIAIRSLEDVSV